MNRKNTLIFDLDGTLLDTLEDLTISTNVALEVYGYPQRSREEVCSFVGNGIRLLIARALPQGYENPDYEQVFEAFKKHYVLHCNDNTCAYPGIMDLLEQLKKKGYRMAIVSNKADTAVKELAAVYFQDLIAIAIGEKESEGVRKKPAPDTVYEALRLLGSSVEEAVYVGDSEVDIQTAENAGMDAVLCSWGFRTVETLKKNGAEIIIDHPDQLFTAADLQL